MSSSPDVYEPESFPVDICAELKRIEDQNRAIIDLLHAIYDLLQNTLHTPASIRSETQWFTGKSLFEDAIDAVRSFNTE